MGTARRGIVAHRGGKGAGRRSGGGGIGVVQRSEVVMALPGGARDRGIGVISIRARRGGNGARVHHRRGGIEVDLRSEDTGAIDKKFSLHVTMDEA